eukprot:570609-Alexandrium_andersonii.AAC.1
MVVVPLVLAAQTAGDGAAGLTAAASGAGHDGAAMPVPLGGAQWHWRGGAGGAKTVVRAPMKLTAGVR